MALLLVVISMGMATILGMTFLAAQSTSTTASRNIEHHTHARYIAETGLTQAISYIRRNDDWRSEKGQGIWAEDIAFEGGQFTVSAIDDDFLSDPTAPVTLIATGTFEGTTARVRAVVRPDGEGDGGTSGIAVATEVNFGNHARIDSYDSRQGPYGGSNVSSQAQVATNSADSDAIAFGNHGDVHGSLYVGVGGDPAEGISTGGHFSITGVQDANTENIDLPGCSPPDLGASAGDMEIRNNQSITVDQDVKWDDFDAGNHARLYVDGHVTIHVTEDFDTGNDFRIILNPGATLDLYASGGLNLGNDARLNDDSARTTDLTIYNCGSDDISIGNNARIAGAIISPHAEMDTGNGTHLYGQFLGYELNFGNHARFHQDMALHGPSGGGGATPSSYEVIWQ